MAATAASETPPPSLESVRRKTKQWRGYALNWQRVHAPHSSYQQLVRCTEVELSEPERTSVRKDTRRSMPAFCDEIAPAGLDLGAHAAALERLLCAWVLYDPEIGYVQAMNLVASTLLLLLDGDEEASFWVLVTLLRQLPPQFYSRAPSQLLGFWVEVEVLSQLSERSRWPPASAAPPFPPPPPPHPRPRAAQTARPARAAPRAASDRAALAVGVVGGHAPPRRARPRVGRHAVECAPKRHTIVDQLTGAEIMSNHRRDRVEHSPRS